MIAGTPTTQSGPVAPRSTALAIDAAPMAPPLSIRRLPLAHIASAAVWTPTDAGSGSLIAALLLDRERARACSRPAPRAW